MDEILDRFEKTLGAKRKENDETFRTLYKNWGRLGKQEERRKDILQQQKSKRENNLDTFRGILNLMEYAQEGVEIFDNESQARYRPNVYVPGFTRATERYDNVLMLSEWLIEKPSDFSTNWYVTPCPKGTRVLVTSCSGVTKIFTKYGKFMFATSTLLPGGNSQERRQNCSVLDCFFYKDSNTLYILDVLSWNGHIMADGEMDFRHYWLKSKFEELPDLQKRTKTNKLIFSLLPMTPCDTESIQKFMMKYPPLFFAKLDGLLFYHKQGRYVGGETPLVGWLFPYMVPEVLCPGMPIHESYEAGRPIDYVNQATFIQEFEEQLSNRNTFNSGRNTISSGDDSMIQSEIQATAVSTMEAEYDVANTASPMEVQTVKAKTGMEKRGITESTLETNGSAKTEVRSAAMEADGQNEEEDESSLIPFQVPIVA